MTSLWADWLDDGGLPIYDLGAENETAYFLDEHKVWRVLGPNLRRHRLIVPLGGVDCLLEEFEAQLHEWVEDMRSFDGGNGTIIFPIRSFGQLGAGNPEVMQWYVLAGLAYIPNAALGTPLEGADPYQAILQVLHRDQTCQASRDAVAGAQLREIAHAFELKEARDRSRALLEEFLTAEQRDELLHSACFHVQGADGFRYQIRLGQAHNVFRVNETGQRVIEYCLITKGILPVCDQLLAQKVLLETDPETFHKTANAWSLEGGQRVCLTPPTDRHARLPDLIGEQLEIALWRPDTIPGVLDGRGEAEDDTGMAFGVRVQVARERVVAGEPAGGTPEAELVPDLGGAGDGLGVAAVGAGVDAASLDVGAPEAASLAEQVVPPRHLE